MRRVFALVPAVCVAIAAVALLAMQVAMAASLKKPPRAPEKLFPKSESVLKWINEYRTNPEPDKLPDAVHAMGDLGLLRELDSAGVYVGFIAGVLSNNEDKAERLIARMFPMPPEDQVILIRAIAYSTLPNWKGLLLAFNERMPARRVLIDRYLYGEGKTLFDLPMEDGSYVIDAHWGFYFGSGSDRALSRIVAALEWSRDKNSVEKLTLGAMAKWTLASNATRDKELLDALKAQMNVQESEIVRDALREVILGAETFETAKIRRDAVAAIDELKAKGPQFKRDYAWWGQAGQTTLGLGCVAAAALGQVQFGIPCVVGGALSSAALHYLGPQ